MTKKERLKKEECKNNFLCILTWGTGIVAVLLLLLAVISLFCDKLNVCFAHFYNVAELFIIVFTLSIAIKTYQRSKKVDEAEMLINLRKLLSSKSNMEIHGKLLGQSDPKGVHNGNSNHNEDNSSDPLWDNHKAEVYNYLGTLELMDILLEDGVLNEEDFKNQFVYRIESVFDPKNKGIQELFTSEEDQKYWSHLNALKDKYVKVNN